MKKYLLFILLFLSLLAATNAQGITGPNPVRYSLTDPTGNACDANSPPLVYGTGSTRNIYTCQSGVYAVGTGSGSVPSATATVEGKAVLGAKDTVAIASLGTCAAGNVGQSKRISDGSKETYTCTNTTGSTYRWIADIGGVFNVRRFGATGDGTTDDSTAINAAVDAATFGSIIDFPNNDDGTAAVYRITTSIKIRQGLTYRGRGFSPFASDSLYKNTYIKPAGAIWVFERHPSISNVIAGVRFENLSIAFNTDTDVLGVWNWSGISWSSITDVGVYPANSTTTRRYIVKLTGGGYGAYYNNFTNINIYRGTTITAFYFTAAANENKIYGGSCQNCDKPVMLDDTNGISFYGFGSDGGQNVTYSFVNSSNNRVFGGRSEHYPEASVSFSRASNVVTVTHSGAKTFAVGQWVYAYATGDSSFDNHLSPAQIASVPSTTTFTYAQTGADATTTGNLYFGSVAAFDSTSKKNTIAWVNNTENAKFAYDASGGYNTLLNNGSDYENQFTISGISTTAKDLLKAPIIDAANTFTAQNIFQNSADAQSIFRGYTSVDSSNASNANGEIFLGNTAASRGVIRYNGANSAKLYIDNTYNADGFGIVMRTKTAGTPVVNATFQNSGATIPNIRLTNLAFTSTAPTVTSAGTSPSITANNGTAAFVVDVGTGGTATTIVLGLPTATTGWICNAVNITATAANRADQSVRQTSSTTTSVTLQNQTVSTGAALAFTASDLVRCQCTAY